MVREFQLPGATGIQLVHDSLYWLADDGTLNWLERWHDDEDPIVLRQNVPIGSSLEATGTSPPSEAFEFNPHHVLCLRTDAVQCWTWRPGWVARERSAASLRELPLPPDARDVVVGPTLVVTRTDGELLFLDQDLEGWQSFSQASIAPASAKQIGGMKPEVIAGDGVDRRQPVKLRFPSGVELECKVGEKVLCGPTTSD